MRRRLFHGSMFSIVVHGLLTLAFAVFLISQIIRPTAMGRIGTDPATGQRWAPTLFEKIFGYAALSVGTAFGGLLTLASVESYIEKTRRNTYMESRHTTRE